MCLQVCSTIILGNNQTLSGIHSVTVFPHLTYTYISHELGYVGTVETKIFVQIIKGGLFFHPDPQNLLTLLTSKKTASVNLCCPSEKHCIAWVICLKGHCDVKLGPKFSNCKHSFF